MRKSIVSKSVDDMAQKIHHLQSVVLFTLKGDSLATNERLNALEEEVRLLWAASRKYNFDLHVLESKAQDAEDRLETAAPQEQKFINNFSDDPLLKMLGPNSDPIYLELCISSRESLQNLKGLTMSYNISSKRNWKRMNSQQLLQMRN